jgi:hypothetical protein
MLFVIVLGVLFLYPPTASWALRGGGAPRLWLAFVGGALGGGIVGLAGGIVLAVYGLRPW